MSEKLQSLKEFLKPKNFPKDIILIILWLAIAVITIYSPAVNETFLRIVFTVPVILFIPGYALIAALFPRARIEGKGINGIERFALSVGLSIAVVPLIGLALNYTPFGIRLDPVVICLVIFTLIMAVITLIRRGITAAEERFYVPFEKIFPSVKNALFSKEQKPVEKVLSVILIIAILIAAVTTVYVIVNPKDGEKFTEFYILGADKMADNYPAKFDENAEQSVYVGVKNHEYRDVTYTMDVLFLNAEWDDETNSSKINKEMSYVRVSIPVENAGEYLEPFSFTISDISYNRVEFLLYDDTNVPAQDATAQEKMDAAYRDLHLWVTVNEHKFFTLFEVTSINPDASEETSAKELENVVSDTGLEETEETAAAAQETETSADAWNESAVQMTKYTGGILNMPTTLATIQSTGIVRPVGGTPTYPESSYTWYNPAKVLVHLYNHEYAEMTYTVDVVLLQNKGTSIGKTWTLDRFSITAADGAEVNEVYDFTLWKDEYNEVAFLLYKDDDTVPAFDAGYADKAVLASSEKRIEVMFG
ncbi:MAG TPA: DUF1616 domain-containing protein [Methanocorpusculum sp.]|nr:DUF1616 domain-containing protein [Methanocorpusculum sp.]